MKRFLALFIALTLITVSFVSCNKKTDDETPSTDVITDSTALTFDQVRAEIANFKEMTDSDKVTVLKTPGYDISLAEFRYYYLTYSTQFPYYYGFDWKENEQYYSEFETYMSEGLKMCSAIVAKTKELGINLTKKDLEEKVYATYSLLQEQYGESTDDTITNSFYATPYYVLLNESVFALYNSIYEKLYNEGEKSDELAKKALDYYNENDYVRAKHILIIFPENEDGSEVTEEQKAECLKKANDALARYKAGENFDDLVLELGEDPGMTQYPDGYYFGKGQMVEAFEETAYSLKEGEVSEPVETPYGYHVILRLPLEDAIKNSDQYTTLAYADFDEMIIAARNEITLEKVENFDELIAPVLTEAEEITFALELQQQAMTSGESTQAQ